MAALGAIRHVFLDDRECFFQLLGRTELNDLGAGVEERKMPGSYVVGLARFDDRVAISAAVLEFCL